MDHKEEITLQFEEFPDDRSDAEQAYGATHTMKTLTGALALLRVEGHAVLETAGSVFTLDRQFGGLSIREDFPVNGETRSVQWITPPENPLLAAVLDLVAEAEADPWKIHVPERTFLRLLKSVERVTGVPVEGLLDEMIKSPAQAVAEHEREAL